MAEVVYGILELRAFLAHGIDENLNLLHLSWSKGNQNYSRTFLFIKVTIIRNSRKRQHFLNKNGLTQHNLQSVSLFKHEY